MAEMSDMLEQLLGGQADQIGARIGADPEQTRQAISVALPALVTGLQQQATPGSGLQEAIERDHDGSILDDLSGYFQGSANLDPRTTNGAGILDHVFGDGQQGIHQAVSAKTGLDMGTIAQLLPLLAPVVMGMLGKQARSENGPTGGLGDLGSILGGLGGLAGAGSTTSSGSPQGLGDVIGSIFGGKRGS